MSEASGPHRNTLAPNLHLDRLPEDWEQLESELRDDPSLTIDALSPEEQARIVFRVIASSHDEDATREGVARMGQVDYLVREAVLDYRDAAVYGGRVGHDLANIMLSRGLPVSVHIQEADEPPQDVALGEEHVDPYFAAYLAETGRHGKPPVYRSIDIINSEPHPLPQFRNYLEAAEYSYELEQQLLVTLNTAPNSELRQLLGEQTVITGSRDASRDQKQIDDLSIIAANAVRRHPEKDKIVIGVNFGAYHDMVLPTLLEGTQAKGTLEYVPATADPKAPHYNVGSLMYHYSLTGEEPTEDELNRVLALRYLVQFGMLLTKDPNLGPQIENIVNNHMYAQLSDVNITPWLEAIDAIKQTNSTKGLEARILANENRKAISLYLLRLPENEELMNQLEKFMPKAQDPSGTPGH